MRMATCQCGEGGTINVQGPEYGRSFGRGSRVDLDAPVQPGSSLTWGQALGHHVDELFVLDAAPPRVAPFAPIGLGHDDEKAEE